MHRYDLIRSFSELPENSIGLIGSTDYSSAVMPYWDSAPSESALLDGMYKYLSERFFLFYNFGASRGRFFATPMFYITDKYPYVVYNNLSFPPLETYITSYLLSLPFLTPGNVIGLIGNRNDDETATFYHDLFFYSGKHQTEEDEKIWDILFTYLWTGIQYTPKNTYPLSIFPERRRQMLDTMFRVFEDISTYEFGMDYGIDQVVYKNGIPYLNRERDMFTPAQKSLTLLLRHALDRYLIFNFNHYGPYFLEYNGFTMLPSTPTLWYYLSRRNEFLDLFEQSLLIPYNGDTYPEYKGKKTYLEVLYIYLRDMLFWFDLVTLSRVLQSERVMGDNSLSKYFRSLYNKYCPDCDNYKDLIQNTSVFHVFDPKKVSPLPISLFIVRNMYGIRNLPYYESKMLDSVHAFSADEYYFMPANYVNIDTFGYIYEGDLVKGNRGLSNEPPKEGLINVSTPERFIGETIIEDEDHFTGLEKHLYDIFRSKHDQYPAFETLDDYVLAMQNRAWPQRYLVHSSAMLAVSPVLWLYPYTQSFFGKYTQETFEAEIYGNNVANPDWLDPPSWFSYDDILKRVKEYRQNPGIFKAQSRQMSQAILGALYDLGPEYTGYNFTRTWEDELVLFLDEINFWGVER
ncbi:MAG: hypothetical protein GPW19_03070 [Euryarchaeota archaeon]|nr:hypothetical protein [Euryarchaeota archaeon]